MSDTPTGETVDASKNDATPQSVPAPAPVKAEDQSEIERLRKELEQKTMRENQLANQLKAREEADAKAREKELEEQNKFKELYEQERSKREAIESEREEADRLAELAKAKTAVLSEYNDEVKALAEEVGLDLIDTDETAVAAFKEKLEKINSKVANTATVGPNNNKVPTNQPELSTEELRQGLQDDVSFHDIVTKRFPGIAAMTNQKK